MQTKNQIKSKGGFMPLITYLNLIDPNFDDESVLMIEKEYPVERYRSEDKMPTMLQGLADPNDLSYIILLS